MEYHLFMRDLLVRCLFQKLSPDNLLTAVFCLRRLLEGQRGREEEVRLTEGVDNPGLEAAR